MNKFSVINGVLAICGDYCTENKMTDWMNSLLDRAGDILDDLYPISRFKNFRPASCTVFGVLIGPPTVYFLTIAIKGVKDTTLLSVSHACAEDMCGIFTLEDCKFFSLTEALPHIATNNRSCSVMMRREVVDRLYIQKSILLHDKVSLLVTSIKDIYHSRPVCI